MYIEEPEKFIYELDKIISEIKSFYLKKQFNINIESIIFYHNQFNTAYFKKIISEKIKLGEIYQIPYYHDYIMKCINKLYNELQNMEISNDTLNDNYQKIYEDFEIIVSQLTYDYFEKKDDLDQFNSYLTKNLESKTNYYIYSKVIDKNSKNNFKKKD